MTFHSVIYGQIIYQINSVSRVSSIPTIFSAKILFSVNREIIRKAYKCYNIKI